MAVPSMHQSTNPTVNQSIYLSIHPLSNHPFICYPTIHSFIQSTSLLAGKPTHHWSNDWPCNGWINTLLNGIIVSAYRHNGQVLFVQFISKVAKLCRAITWANSSFSSTYMVATKRKKWSAGKGTEQWVPFTHVAQWPVHAKLFVMTQDN